MSHPGCTCVTPLSHTCHTLIAPASHLRHTCVPGCSHAPASHIHHSCNRHPRDTDTHVTPPHTRTAQMRGRQSLLANTSGTAKGSQSQTPKFIISPPTIHTLMRQPHAPSHASPAYDASEEPLWSAASLMQRKGTPAGGIATKSICLPAATNHTIMIQPDPNQMSA